MECFGPLPTTMKQITQKNNIPFRVDQIVIRQIHNSYALWFANSKSFILLQEPAFEVYRLYEEGTPIRQIKEICHAKFGNLEADIPRFVEEIIRYLRYFNDPKNAPRVSIADQLLVVPQCHDFFSSVNYQLGKTKLQIRYPNDYFKLAIHPLISHLETEHDANPKNILECFEQDDLLILKCNGALVAAFGTEDFEFFKGAVSQQIYSLIYQRGFNDWMMMLHASGVIAKQQAIVFSAAAGSGKSTIAALLKAHDYQYLSDDFIATDDQGKVYPFPSAISVKEGAVKTLSTFYPELKTILPEEAFTGKIVRYIPVHNLTDESAQGYPVKAFVFVNYSADEPFMLEKVETQEALQLLLKETWVNPTADNVSCFFDWLQKTAFYRLNYSTTQQAIEAVEKLVLG